MLKAVEILTKAKELISSPEHWCQEAYSRDKNGVSCDRKSPDVNSFCIIGSVFKVLDEGVTYDEEIKVWKALNNVNGDYAISTWNDKEGRTHDEVMAFLDQAIEKVKDLTTSP
jgi:hypothetical protein